MQKFHMISGLPRSGSTLLSSILNQNPRFSAGISNPLYFLMKNAIRAFSENAESTQCSEQKRLNVLKGVIQSYYQDDSAEVVFNTSRTWTAELPLMNILVPNAKVICCVRDIGWILDSFEQLYNENPTIYSNNMYGSLSRKMDTNIYMRTKNFMHEDGSFVAAYNSLKTAYYSEYNNKLIFIEYEHLTNDPQKTIEKIYNFIDEPHFNHDFDDVEVSYDEYDQAVQVKGLHNVRKKIAPNVRNTVVPPDIWKGFDGMEFWRA